MLNRFEGIDPRQGNTSQNSETYRYRIGDNQVYPIVRGKPLQPRLFERIATQKKELVERRSLRSAVLHRQLK